MREQSTKTFCLTTLGCKANQYDSSAMEEILAALPGYRAVTFPGPADVCIINTCTVTANSDTQSRGLIRRARRFNPNAVVIVTGCYAEVSSAELSALHEADYVLGNPAKGEIASYVQRGRRAGAPLVAEGADAEQGRGVPWSLRARTASGRTRINLKIQDGCDMSCSYCLIPRARGHSRSLPLVDLEAEIGEIVERGFKEIILTGIHLGAWGRDLTPPRDITALMEFIESKKYPCRFRVSSIDPDEVTEDFVELISGGRSICNHLHLPLQSGDDRILKLMRRRHDSGLFSRVVTTLVERVQGIAIGSDVIVGFPGEGQREFENTYALLKDLPIAYLHVFPFSPRSGTAASALPGRVDGLEIKKRCALLRALGEEKKKDFCERFIGTSAEVLVEGTRDRETGLAYGKTGNYINVLIEPEAKDGGGADRVPHENELLTMRLKGPMWAKGLRGEITRPSSSSSEESRKEVL